MIITKTDNLISTGYELVACQSVENFREILSLMSWRQLSAVKIDKGDVALEGSGSVEDGFSVVYYEAGSESVTPRAPTLQDLIDIMVKFYANDTAWKNNRAWMKSEPPSDETHSQPLWAKLIVGFGGLIAPLCIASLALYYAYSSDFSEDNSQVLPYFTGGVVVFLLWEFWGFYKKQRKRM